MHLRGRVNAVMMRSRSYDRNKVKRQLHEMMKETAKEREQQHITRSKTIQSSGIHDDWAIKQTINKVRYSYLLMAYMFLNDDGTFSKQEKKLLKKRLKKDKDYLSKETMNRIISFLDEDLTLAYVLDYLQEHTIPTTYVKTIIQELKEDVSYNSHYVSLLNQLDSELS